MSTARPFLILLTAAGDRRCFDLFHWLRKRQPTWQFGIMAPSLSRLEAYLYPGMEHIAGQHTADLLAIIAADPARDYIYLPWLEPELATLLDSKSNWPPNLKLLLPEADRFVQARNKIAFTELFQAEGLTPRLYTLEDLHNHFPATGVVAKPAHGKSAIGRQYIDDPAHIDRIHTDDVIQERIGAGREVVGAFYLRIKGEIKGHYLHRRIRTYPDNGGVSVCAETFVHPEISARGAQILAKLQWEGLAMVEFLERPGSGEWVAIELNPRLWGSVLLGEYAGHALVEQYICHCAGLSFTAPQPKAWAQMRWYFPYELLYVLKKPWQRWRLLGIAQQNTCYVNATGTGALRAILFIVKSVLDPHKWEMMAKKAFGWR